MLWLALYFPQLPLEVFVRGRQQAGALVVVEQQGGREQVSRCNAAAQAYGIRPGLMLPAALALCAGLSVQARERAREQQALHELALWAYQFSARISFEPSLLLLEVGASLRLFGGLSALMAPLLRELGQMGYTAQYAVAPTPTAAALLARNRPVTEVLDRQQIDAAVHDLPLACLTRDQQVRDLIRHIGLGSIGDALDLPRPELTRRTTPALSMLLDRLLGRMPDPREAWQPPQHFAQTIELLGEITHTTALVFPARRLMVSLCGFLRGHGGGAQRLQWHLTHRDLPATHFGLGMLDPSRDPDHMLELFRERIERLQLPAPVIEIRLAVSDWQAFEERSLTLFDGQADVDHALLERLRNRLGEQRVRGLRCLADHRPERAWCLCEPGELPDVSDHSAVARASHPPWLLPQPRPLRERQGVPQYGGELRLEQLPERIETGWWDGYDITRDYFIAHSRAGERLWVFRDRRGGGWYLHGLFI
ncbi:Y-family DNA polymerase [Thiosocius teredinicola]|uniref:Y-family DNA polymerase n=1 Tax=Thiosocius teredinicola TaxID=1973002 RepID=UPI00099130CA